VLVDGALEARPAGPKSFSSMFDNLGVGRQPASVEAHVGIGDGQQWPDLPLLAFGAWPVDVALTGSNAFSGTDGPAWDDQTVPVPTWSVPAGTNGLGLRFTADGDSLVWSYSALAVNE
jgi:hypothetical protein